MLHNWANDGGFVILKRAAEDRELWRHRERMSKNLLYSRRLLMMLMMMKPPSKNPLLFTRFG